MSRQETMIRIRKTLLTLIAAFLIFAGPTYVVFLAQKIGISYAYSLILGIVLLVLGLIIVFRLVKAGELE